MARTPAPKSKAAVGIRAYGKTKGELINYNSWLKQDYAKHWTTKSEKTGESFGETLGKIADGRIAKEAAQAVSDYMADSEFAQSVQDGKIMQRLRVYNTEASIITQTDVFGQMMISIREAKASIHDPQSQAFLAAVDAGARRVLQEIQRNSTRPPVEEDLSDASHDDSDTSGFDINALENFR